MLFILLSFNKTVVGDAVYIEMDFVFFTERLHCLHKPEHTGRNAVHIKRNAEHDCLRVMKLIQDTGIIGRGVQLFSNLFSSGEQSPL